MRLEDFNYALPTELIATVPLVERSQSRLLIVAEESLQDQNFSQILEHINPGDLLISNNSRVVKARLFGTKASGGKVEVMLERIIDDRHCLAHIRTSKSIKLGMEVFLAANLIFTVTQRCDGLFILASNQSIDLYAYLELHGNLPLPPYMQRQAEIADDTRYQTVYAKHNGSVAAPTAGLHFTPELLQAIQAKGAQIGEITLHVGSGTFKPVAVENIAEHKMHSERFEISAATIDLITATKARGNKVICVGTTSLRTLESAAAKGMFPSKTRLGKTHIGGTPEEPSLGEMHLGQTSLGQTSRGTMETDIFITPGYRFKIVDKLITNFHLPKSTLLMLVAAFSGKARIDQAYCHAIKNKYRFFSYGDAMLLTCTAPDENYVL